MPNNSLIIKPMPREAVRPSPFPWIAENCGNRVVPVWYVEAANGRTIANCFKGQSSYGFKEYDTFGEDEANARLLSAAPDLLQAARCALADLEGILPEFEPSGDREHPAWQTIAELKAAIFKATAVE